MGAPGAMGVMGGMQGGMPLSMGGMAGINVPMQQ